MLFNSSSKYSLFTPPLISSLEFRATPVKSALVLNPIRAYPSFSRFEESAVVHSLIDFEMPVDTDVSTYLPCGL